MTKTKATHTPGPWKISGSYRIKREDGRIIARTDYEHNDENDANARLIAAAPELLEVAKRLLAVSHEPCICNGITPRCLKCVTVAAVAKAEGR